LCIDKTNCLPDLENIILTVYPPCNNCTYCYLIIYLLRSTTWKLQVIKQIC